MDDVAQELSARLGEALRARGWRLATAESCTGGGVAHALTAVAGSSDWFEGGWVTYSNALKTAQLGVGADVLAAYGAVSRETALAMAEGAATHAGVEVGVSTTGIAGPGGGTPDKPVGTVWFAWSVAGEPSAEIRRFDGDREAVRSQAVRFALEGLLLRLA